MALMARYVVSLPLQLQTRPKGECKLVVFALLDEFHVGLNLL